MEGKNYNMSEIKQNIKKGLFWTAIDKYSGQIIGIGISMVLARLLTPYDYGIVATATVIINFLSIFTSIGIGPAVIQKKELSQSDIDNIFTFTVVLGLICGLICFISASFVSEYYENPIITPVLQLFSIGVFLSAVNMVPAALMSKYMRFKETATRSFVFQVFFGILGIIAAYYGAGIYALIIPPIISSLCTFVYNYHFYPVKIKFLFDFTPIKKIFSFSSYLFLFELFNYFSRNIDKIIIGKYISENALGYYEKSYRLMQLPLQNITAVIYPVLQPVFSTLQENPKEIGAKFVLMISKISLIGFPLGALLYFCASDIIVVMFGTQWIPAIPAFKILAISVPISLIANPTGPIFLSCNASKRLFFTGVTNTLVTIFGFICALYIDKSIVAIASGWTITSIINMFNTYIQLYCYVIKSDVISVFKSLLHPLICSGILIFTFFFTDIIIYDSPPFFGLCLKSIIALFIALLYYNITKSINLKVIMSYLHSKIVH